MLFCVKAIDQQGENREFSFGPNKLEEGFDFLNSLVAKGENTLLDVYLLEGGRVTHLPVEVFEGFPFSDVIKQLESEWVNILNQHFNDLTSIQGETNEIEYLLDTYEKRIVQLESDITRMRQLLQRAEMHNEVNSPLTNHYKSILNRFIVQLLRICGVRDRLLNRGSQRRS